MDFSMYPEWATQVPIYDRAGNLDTSINFNAQVYLNRFAHQYQANTVPVSDPKKLWKAWDGDWGAPDIECEGVPYKGVANWWAALMSYPTMVGFIAPLNGMADWQAGQWTDALVGLCDLSTMVGKFCDTSYFGAGQEVISLMVLSGKVQKGGPPPRADAFIGEAVAISTAGAPLRGSLAPGVVDRGSDLTMAASSAAAFFAFVALAAIVARGRSGRGDPHFASYLTVEGAVQ